MRFIYFISGILIVTTGLSFTLQKLTLKPAIRLIVFKNWSLDIDALKLINSIGEEKVDTVWKVGNEISWRNVKSFRFPEPYLFINNDTLVLTSGYKKGDQSIYNYIISLQQKRNGRIKWEYSPETPLAIGESVKYIREENRLYIGVFSYIATGSDLVCLDIATGKEIWHAPVKQLMAEHSKYYNDIFLKLVDDKIVLAGLEASGEYLQVFDKNTGKLLFAELSM